MATITTTIAATVDFFVSSGMMATNEFALSRQVSMYGLNQTLLAVFIIPVPRSAPIMTNISF